MSESEKKPTSLLQDAIDYLKVNHPCDHLDVLLAYIKALELQANFERQRVIQEFKEELEAVAREAFEAGQQTVYWDGDRSTYVDGEFDEYWQNRTRLQALDELAADAQKNDMGYGKEEEK